MADVQTNANYSNGQAYRLASGGLIDRSHSLMFTFDGKRYYGHAGDTLASALVANGVRLVGRSFKYHRPRGLLSAGYEETNGLVELRDGARREPNTRSTGVELYEGLICNSQNRWPSLRHDVLSVNSLLAPVLSAGFYYKTFMWPSSFWERLYEPLIRRAAGLGRSADAPDPDRYEASHAFCDVLVVGAGPAGLAAALAAGRSGARVILCEQDFALGGRCLVEPYCIDGMAAADWAAAMEHRLDSLPEVRVMRRTAVFGAYDGRSYVAAERVSDHKAVPDAFEPRQRLWHIVARQCILASGSLERPLVFPNNDLPGIMLAGAVRTYVNRFAAVPGSRAAVVLNNDDAVSTASCLHRAGVPIAAIIDTRERASAQVQEVADATGASLFEGATIARALGGLRVSGLEVEAAGKRSRVSCDLVAMSCGWDPVVHLSTHLGTRPSWDPALSSFIPGAMPPGMAAAGAASGRFDLASCLSSGTEQGVAAATACGFQARTSTFAVDQGDARVDRQPWKIAASKGKAFVDFQNDVTTADIELAQREGYTSVEQVKRYTTLGMATDQGKTSGVNGLAVLANAKKVDIQAVGVTTFRPPFIPVAMGLLAGHNRGAEFRPVRRTPLHAWSSRQGAVFTEVGLWLRAQYYPRPGDSDWTQAVRREVNAVRSSVGVCDISTFGKIDIQGPDAVRFLERVYCNNFASLPIGKARFGLMLREDGFILDDGTTSRLMDDHYVMTTSTANAGKVMEHLEYCHQVLWPELDVQMVSVTDQWAQLAVAGPRSREVLQRILDEPELISADRFAFLAAAELRVCGDVCARLFRLSFSGELAYELAVPARHAEVVMDKLMAAGAEFDILAYGTEALGTLRIEKGHAAGAEINGQTTAHDLGMGRLLSTKKDYVGRVMALRPALTSPERPTLVGLKPLTGERLAGGAHLVTRSAPATAQHDAGYVTSAAYSPSLGHWIGLALLRGGGGRLGEIVRVVDPLRGTKDVLAEVCAPCFIDPEGVRVHE